MACGLPIISTHTQEGAVQNGKNGYIIPIADTKAIVDGVLKMFEKNEIKKMGRLSKKIIKKYDWSVIAKKAITEYEKLI